jgi:hypothetical protein
VSANDRDITLVVEVTRADEDRWRKTLGQADMDAWCAVHGLDSKNVASGSVRIARFSDGYQLVSLYEFVRDPDGLIVADGDDARKRLHANIPLRRSLPEGIGKVIR